MVGRRRGPDLRQGTGRNVASQCRSLMTGGRYCAPADLDAIAVYLKTIKPISNEVASPVYKGAAYCRFPLNEIRPSPNARRMGRFRVDGAKA